MLNEDKNFDSHERFKELGALANSGTLSAGEWWELKRHLHICADCRGMHNQYQLLSAAGMPFLAAAYGDPQERENWDDSQARETLLTRIRAPQQRTEGAAPKNSFLHSQSSLRRLAVNQWVKGALAACVAAAVLWVGHGIVSHREAGAKQVALASVWQQQTRELAAEKKSSDEVVESQGARIAQMQEQGARQEQEVDRLRTALLALEDHSRALVAAEGKTQEQLRAVSEQRDSLTAQLQQAEQSYQNVKAELTTLRAEHERTLVHTASLESKISDLAAANREQERRMGDDEQFLASDRDIRELMGARNLYIADVFDVDAGSRTRKPFGRVFYTQNKSLIFYAFDLDHQAGIKNASIFQVWGQKDAELTQKARPLNLGILYMDSESNRRWVLRLDDAKQLAEIDAVFVTVEPHGGSPKPTGKPFLYALLRTEANHP